MNKIFLGVAWCPVKWSVKIPFTLYWIALVDMGDLRVLEVVAKYFDPKTGKYYYNRTRYSWLAPWGKVKINE